MVPEYEPDPVGTPDSLKDLTAYITRELERIRIAIAQTGSKLEPLSKEPQRKTEGLLVNADGFHWNPGQGSGLYVWIRGAWYAVQMIPVGTGNDTDPPVPVPDPTVPPTDPALKEAGFAIATFHCVGIYWTPPKPVGPAGATLQYKRAVDSVWKDAHPLWYDTRNSECRGSIVDLASNTDYDVRFGVPGDPIENGLRFKTWNEVYPEGTVTVDNAGVRTTQLKITQGGTASAYRVYQAHPSGTKITLGETTNCFEVQASYVIIRGYETEGGKQVVNLGVGVHDVLIEGCDFHGWGQYQADFGGIKRGQEYDSALFYRGPYDGTRHVFDPNLKRIVFQRNKVHDPKYGANSWQYGHPHGPHGITLWETGGNHVIRYNEFYSSSEAHYYNDAIGGGENFSNGGAPGADTDVYQNYVQGHWDDGIECEGGGCNVRIFRNYIDGGAAHIATTPVVKGPMYIFRNVGNRSRMRADLGMDNSTSRGRFGKSHSVGSWGGGRRYFFHNTVLQAAPSGPGAQTRPMGAGRGISGASGEPMTNTYSRNNIIIVYVNTEWSVNAWGGAGNDFNYDLYNGKLSDTAFEVNGIKVNPDGSSALPLGPIYKAGHGPELTYLEQPSGKYQLDVTSPGYNAGTVINNFSDGFVGAAPDMGAHENGTSDMVFGTTA